VVDNQFVTGLGSAFDVINLHLCRNRKCWGYRTKPHPLMVILLSLSQARKPKHKKHSQRLLYKIGIEKRTHVLFRYRMKGRLI